MTANTPTSAAPDAAVTEFAVGLALTDDCDLHCAHCYRDTLDVGHLTLADVRAICDAVAVRSVNLGTGENGLHPEYHDVLAFLRQRGVRHTLTTNGYSVAVLDDDELRGFHSVEVSIDFPTAAEQDAFRAPGNWEGCLGVLGRCRRLGVAAGVTAVMMSVNYDRLVPIARLAAGHGATFRVNVYQPVKTDRFARTYDAVWEGFRRLFAEPEGLACTEPVGHALLGLGGRRPRLRQGHPAGDGEAARPPLRLLAGPRGGAGRAGAARRGRDRLPRVAAAPHRARRLPGLPVRRHLPGRVCQSPTLERPAGRAGRVLPHRPRGRGDARLGARRRA